MNISFASRYAGAFALAFALLLPSVLPGQENTGTILGIVTDDTGATVPDAKVEVAGSTLPRGLQTTSNGSGEYQFARVPIGTYSVTVSKTGFNTLKQQEVIIRLGSQVTVNAKLSVGQVSQVVEVQESAVSIDPTSSRTSTNISSDQFMNIPRGRTFNSLLAMVPGVRSEVKAGSSGVGGISVDGASGSENAFFIDGVEVSDVRRGSLRGASALPFELVGEIQVKSGGFEAEYGGATGGVINVATKAGSNNFHGQMFMQAMGDFWNASDRGYWQRSAANASIPEFFKPKTDEYKVLYPGFVFGGPILKNRLFFNAAYSPELENSNRTIDYAAGARTYEQTEFRHYGLARVDYQPFQKLSLSSSWTWSPVKRNGGLPNRDNRLSPPSNNQSILGGYQPSQQASVSATYTATSRLIFTARYGYRYLNDKLVSNGNYGVSSLPFITYMTSSTGFTDLPPGVSQGTNYVNTTTTINNIKDITTRNNVYLDGTYIVGRHTFKAGYQINRLSNDTLNDYTNGRFIINWGQTFSRADISNATGRYGYYTWEDGVKNSGSVNSRNQGFYVQDTWRVIPRLTINAGVRFENEFIPPYKQQQNGVSVANPISFDWGSKIAPRIGVAYDLLGDGKWKLAGSYGLFYDSLKYEIARGSFGSDVWISNVYTLDNPNVFQLGLANPGILGTPITSYNNRTLDINAQGQIEGVDPGIKPYTAREFSFSLEHSLTNRVVGSVRYVRKDLLKAIEDIGVLLPNGDEQYLIGNPGFGQTRNDPTGVYNGKTPSGEYLVPKATREYNAVELSVRGQFRRSFFSASYTWSRLYGNYSGPANSDESGRSDPGVSRAFDLPYYYFDASGSQKNVEGLLGTDRPHTIKLFGNYELASKVGTTNFGLTQIAYSGTPDTSTIVYLSAPTTPYGRGDLGRTPFLTQTDLMISHKIKTSESTYIQLEANAVNLLNQATVTTRTVQMNQTGAISAAQLPTNANPGGFFAGYDPKRFLSANGATGTIPANSIYGLPGYDYRNGGIYSTIVSSAFYASNPGFSAYQSGRVLRLGVRFNF